MVKVLVTIAAVLALFVGVAGPADAAPKPKQLAAYSYVDVPLVDDDGVTRLFGITANVYSYPDGTVQVTCTYSVRGRDVPDYEPNGIYVPEGYYRITRPAGHADLPTDLSYNGLKQYCIDHFDERIRRDPDPTPGPTS